MSSGSLPFNVQSVTVSGQLTVDGAATSSTAGEGVFVPEAAGTSSLGTGRVGAYSVRLIPGVYGLNYRPTSAECAISSTVPCVSGRLRSGLPLTSSGTVTQDISTFMVSGQVTLNGAPLPDSDGSRGQLLFTSSAGAGSTNAFGSRGAVMYMMRMLSGSYAVLHQAQAARCASGYSQGGIPCSDQYVAGCP